MLIIVIGNLGSGKTFLVVLLNLNSKKEVWSNFKINIDNYRKLEVIDLLDLKDNINIIMDEAYAWIESRVSSTALNEYLSSILFHTRKTTIDIYITTPMFSTIDKRFRKMANYIIQCENRSNPNIDDFKYTFYNVNNNTFGKKTLSYNKAKKYFKYFNTFEKIDSHRKKGLEFKILKKYPLRLKEKVIEITNLVKINLENNTNGKTTHETVKGALLDIGIDLDYEASVYIRLKSNYDNN